ncbi:hypothetical protein [Desulfococcus sp.]|uniref:hypothetical protein n=1 Tax=Desulfococcus sp. TaxID=2025834 RepID=UPI0035932C25
MTTLRVEHQCPQCGAPAVLEETDRIFTCGYCRVSSYLLQDGCFRYMLPHAAPEGRNLLYFPYWRCRGMLFSCGPDTIHQRAVDHSLPAAPAACFPQSLGLRSQAMTLRPASGGNGTRFISPAAAAPDAVLDFKAHFRRVLPEPVHVDALVGETLSMIYAPFYVDNALMDAVLNRPVAQAGPAEEAISDLPSAGADWTLRFVPTLCPNCGWDMAAEKDALSLACPGCRTLWRAGKDGLKRMTCLTLPDLDGFTEGRLFLPFWRITASVSGLPLASYADFARQANLPKVLRDGWEIVPFHFWTPALRLSPQGFLKAACAMTLAQPGDAPAGELPDGRCHPVTLAFTGAVPALKILMAALLRPKNRILPRLAGMTVSVKDGLLVYVPFRETPHEYVHSRFGLCIGRNMLRLSRQPRG